MQWCVDLKVFKKLTKSNGHTDLLKASAQKMTNPQKCFVSHNKASAKNFPLKDQQNWL